jgi:hypothetical protein
MLRLNRERHRIRLIEPVAPPETLEQIETELASQRLLDHLAVPHPIPEGAVPVKGPSVILTSV